MPKLPGAEQLGGLPSARSGRMIAQVDLSATGKGLQAFGQGIEDLGEGAARAQARERKENDALDLAKAEAKATVDLTAYERGFDEDPDAATYGERFDKDAPKVVESAGTLIRNPKVRELWAVKKSEELARSRDRIVTRGNGLIRERKVVDYDNALTPHRDVLADPNASDEARAIARANLENGIQTGEGVGLYSPAQAEDRREKLVRGSILNREIMRAEKDPEAVLPAAAASGGDAAGLIEHFEGFRETPYFDVNAERVGYGSDTATRADGTVEKVTKGTRVTREEARLDLDRRIGEFQDGIKRDVGADVWDKLPGNVTAPLSSVAYNYGSLPESVVAAVKTGDAGKIATAVEGLRDDNDGVNADRRAREAAIIRGGDVYADLTPEERFKVRETAERSYASRETAFAKQRVDYVAQEENRLKTRILNGEAGLADVEQARADWLTDPDKVVSLRTFVEKAQGDTLTAQRVLSGARLNPYSADDRKAADATYSTLMRGEGADPLAALDTVYRASGVLPPAAVTGLRGALVNPDAAVAEQGMQIASTILAGNPNAFAGYDGGAEIAKSATAFQHYVERGLSADQAARRVVEMGTPEYQSKVKAGEADAKKFSDALSIDDVQSTFGLAPLWGANTEVGFNYEQQNVILSDFREIAQERFRETGDAGLSKEYAKREMSRVYGVTEFDGRKVFMKYPPNKAYPAVRGVADGEPSHDYVYTQAAEAVNGYLRADAGDPADAPMPAEVRPEDIILTHIPNLTGRDFTAGRAPRYQLAYWREENGQRILEVVHGQGFSADPAAAQKEFEATEPTRRAEWEARANDRRALNVGPIGSFGGIARAGEATRPKEELREGRNAAVGKPTGNLSVVERGFLGALETAERAGIGGTAVRLYNDIISRGRTEPITEKDLTPEDTQGFRTIIEKAIEKTGKKSGRINTEDYAPGGKYQEFSGGVDANIIGGFKYTVEGNDILIEDTWDFNTWSTAAALRGEKREIGGDSDSQLMQALGAFAAPGSLAASIGRKTISDKSGKGIPVKITLARGN